MDLSTTDGLFLGRRIHQQLTGVARIRRFVRYAAMFGRMGKMFVDAD